MANSDCLQCRGAGWFNLESPPLTFTLTMCPCLKTTVQARSHRQAVAESGLSDLQGKTFAQFEDRPGVLDALIAAEDFAATPHGCLVLTGAPGCGKTHLAMSIGNAVLARGEAVIFLTVPDALDRLRDAYDPQSAQTFEQRFTLFQTVPLLILDDLGTERRTPFGAERIFQLINIRSEYGRPTVITSNLDIRAATPAQLDPRIRSRLLDAGRSLHIPIQAEDYRLLAVHERRAG